jgi:multisubunit Na+/H+ antiporter MnhF subunit
MYRQKLKKVINCEILIWVGIITYSVISFVNSVSLHRSYEGRNYRTPPMVGIFVIISLYRVAYEPDRERKSCLECRTLIGYKKYF